MSSTLPLPDRNKPSPYEPPPPPQQTLAHYATPRIVEGKQKKAWKAIIRWQFAGLVTVQPINKMTARVVLTAAGRERLS